MPRTIAVADAEAIAAGRPLREARLDIQAKNTELAPAVRQRFDPETIERVLTELALCGGRCRATRRRLADVGIEVGEETMRYWMRVAHADRYAELAATVAPELEKKIAAEAEAYIMRAAEVELRVLNKLAARAERDDADAITLSGVLRNVSVSKSLAMDKVASPIRGRPTVIQAQADNFDQLLARLERLGVRLTVPEAIDATITDAQVVPSDSPGS